MLSQLRLVLLLFSGVLMALAAWPEVAWATDAGNRLTYLDSKWDILYPNLELPKLTTPQWIGEQGVDAAVLLRCDDLSNSGFEVWLRPVLDHLIDLYGHAPVTIACNSPNPGDSYLQVLLNDGAALECHTIHHPCPLLANGNFTFASDTYHDNVDLISSIPNNEPTMFVFPCGDIMNTPSPRGYAEILAKTSSEDNFLTCSSSMFIIYTEDDPNLPASIVTDEEGRPRFAKYLNVGGFAQEIYIENYPYPFAIGQLIWEFPLIQPDDSISRWVPDAPVVREMNAAIDVAVIKKGICPIVFHTYNWMSQAEVNQVIDYADQTYGSQVEFMTIPTAVQLIEQNMLAGNCLRATNGQDNGVRIMDVNNDGYMDVVIGNEILQQTRIWDPAQELWITSSFPVQLVEVAPDETRKDAGVRFGVLQSGEMASFLINNGTTSGVWHFDGSSWVQDNDYLNGLTVYAQPVLTASNGIDRGVRFRDLDKDGICELLVSNPDLNAVLVWNDSQTTWEPADFGGLPSGVTIVRADGGDAGLKWTDVNEDGYDDIVFSDHLIYSLNIYVSISEGFSHRRTGVRPGDDLIPMIVRADGTNNGAFSKGKTMYWQNEDTGGYLPYDIDLVDLYGLISEYPMAPLPSDEISGVQVSTDLSWSPGIGITTQDVYFGLDNPPTTLVASGDYSMSVIDNSLLNGGELLDPGTTYYWQVQGDGGSFSGPIWSFTTMIGLVHHWPFDGDLLDAVGNNDGIENGTVFFVEGADGVLNSAISVTDADFVSSAANISITGPSPRTINFWFNAAQQQEATVSYGGRGSNGELFEVLLGYPTNSYCGHFWGSLMDTADSGSGDQPAVSWNTWTMVTMTYDGTTVQLYQDDVLKRTADLALNTTATPIYIGGGHGSGGQWDYDEFDGQIDDVRVYDYALNADEVTTLYNEMQGIGYVCDSPPTMDFTDDCVVDIADLIIFVQSWLDCGRWPSSQCP
jgi:hypothetical protein